MNLAIVEHVMACPKCANPPTVEDQLYGWVVSCDECYDGAPDGGQQMAVSGSTRAKVVSYWNDLVEEHYYAVKATPCAVADCTQPATDHLNICVTHAAPILAADTYAERRRLLAELGG